MKFHKSEFEKLAERTIAQQRAKVHTYETLKKEGLPIPADLKAEIEGAPGVGFE